MVKVTDLATLSGVTLTPRRKAEVVELFTGFDLLEPGVVPAGRWHEDGEDKSPASCLSYGGVGVKQP
jgi:hypothetical protein